MGEEPVSLEQILDVEKIEVWTYRGFSFHPGSTRAFGGLVAAQALAAAGRTVPGDRGVHSLHAYFLRPGDTGAPILYTVEPVRDGGSFTTRRVLAVQHGEVIFSLSASFQTAEEGVAYQRPVLDAPGPEESAGIGPAAGPAAGTADDAGHDTGQDTGDGPAAPAARAWYDEFLRRFPVEVRFPEADGPAWLTIMRGEPGPPRQRFWVRSRQPLPDDPLVHVCAVTYVSDLFLISSSLPPHAQAAGGRSIMAASLDHAVWFHAPFRFDDWLFYDQSSSWAAGARALCRGLLFDRSGTLVASVMQEGMIRVRDRAGAQG
jgi:acyl-CoA thioesterase II